MSKCCTIKRWLRGGTMFFAVVVICACGHKVDNHEQNTDEIESTDDSGDTGIDGSDSPSTDTLLYTTIDWKMVNPGGFVFGAKENAPCRSAYAENQSNVTLTHKFEMAATEVTQAQWSAQGMKLPSQPLSAPDAPVVLINYYETLRWANQLSQSAGLDACYDLSSCTGDFGAGCDDNGCGCKVEWEGGCEQSPNIYYCLNDVHVYDNWYDCPGYRLPTTAEWEFAARSGTITHTYNGDLIECIEGTADYDTCLAQNFDVLDPIAWYKDNSDNTLHVVAHKQSNAWGFYDMLGNAFEWVDYNTDGQSLDVGDDHAGEDLVDPMGPKEGLSKDLRGGEYGSDYCWTRSAIQFPSAPDIRRNDTGFRPVRSIF